MLSTTRVLYNNLLNKNKNLQEIMQCYFTVTFGDSILCVVVSVLSTAWTLVAFNSVSIS